MLSQTFRCCGKQQSADSNVIPQLHLTMECTKDKFSDFCNSFLVSKWIFNATTAVWQNFTQDPSKPWCVLS